MKGLLFPAGCRFFLTGEAGGKAANSGLFLFFPVGTGPRTLFLMAGDYQEGL
jgi:hypothetical protein